MAEYDDLDVEIHLRYQEADDLVGLILAYGNDLGLADSIRHSMKQAREEERDREKRAPQFKDKS